MNQHPRALANVRAEEAVIGKIIGDANAYKSIAGQLRAEHFTQQHHRDIFDAVARSCEDGPGPSISLLESRLPLGWEGVGDVEPYFRSWWRKQRTLRAQRILPMN